jgi:hypothetical protein
MTIGAGILLIAVGAILRFGISTVSTHGFGIHTIGDILMLVGALGVVLWLLVWAPWAPRSRSRRTTVYREEAPPGRTVYREGVPPGRTVYRDDVPPGEVPPTRRYTVDDTYDDEYRR